MRKSLQSDLLEITSKTLRYGGQVFPIANLTHVGKYRLRKRRKIISGMFILISIGGVIYGLAFSLDPHPGTGGPAIISFLIASLSFIFYLFIAKRKKKYALGIETSSGSEQLFSSNDEEFIDKLVMAIGGVMENQEQNASYTVNIKSATIQDNSIGEAIMGDKFENISHSTIINKSRLTNALNQVMSDYGKDAERALKIVANHIDQCGHKEAIELFNSFNTEIANGNASKTVLRTLWDGVVKVLPDASRVASAVAAITKMLL